MTELGDFLAGIKHEKDNDWPLSFWGKKNLKISIVTAQSRNFCRALTDLKVLKIKHIVS